MGGKKKKTPPPEEFWKSIVHVVLDFYREVIGEEPSLFDGPNPRYLKNILTIIRIRATKKGVEWNEEEATHRMRAFLEHAFKDDWLSKNFLICNLDKFKDKVFLNLITPKKNGSAKFISADSNSSGGFGDL